MKNNKRIQNFEGVDIKKKYTVLIFSNLIAFIIVFVIIGLIITTVTATTFYKSIEDDLYTTEMENINTLSANTSTTNNNFYYKTDNKRILAILYDEDKEVVLYSKFLLEYIIPGYGKVKDQSPKDEYDKLCSTGISRLNENFDEINKFETHSVKDEQGNIQKYSFITLSFEANSKNAKNVKYVKLLIMVNPEIQTRGRIINIYFLSSTILLILAMAASFILSNRAIRPINDSLNQQIMFVNDASHELRTPLAIVKSKLENILTKSDASVKDVSGDIAISLNEVSRLSRLTQDLLVLARSDNGTTLFKFENANIKNTVIDTIDAFKELAEIEERTFRYEIEDDIVSYIDKEKIIQLIIILLDNAIKYTTPGDSIYISIVKNKDEFCINVADTGIGISEETKKRIFERFYREDKARSRSQGGNGLGLAIGKTIVLEHKGKITVDHNFPKGTKFNIVIPIIVNRKETNEA